MLPTKSPRIESKRKAIEMNIALVIAGGVGSRMGQEIPNQFLTVDERPVIVYTLEAFQNHPEIDSIAVVCLEGWETLLRAYARQFGISKLDLVVPGGETGQGSIRNGVFALEDAGYGEGDVVLVHDGIRPMVSERIISDCIACVREHGNGVTVIPCAEAMLTTDDQKSASGQYPRADLKRTQTPQGFRLGDLAQLHRDALEAGVTDSVASCTLMEEMGRKVWFCPGSERNVKLTTVEDIDIFKALLSVRRSDWLH